MTASPTIDDVRRAAERIRGEAVRTPLISSHALDRLVGGRMFLKCESLQRTGSFKFRGAYNAIASLSPEGRERGVVAISSGNHAQGVAAAAKLFNIAATIVMPADAPAVKLERTRALGAKVITYDRLREDREAVGSRYAAEHDVAMIHPYNDPAVIAGQGTIGLEIVEDCIAAGAAPDAIIIPCGGGGLSSGVNLAMRDAFPGIDVVLVEPAGFDDYARSLASGRPVANAGTSGSVCDALLAVSPGAIGFVINCRNARAVAVDDNEALAAVAFAFRELKLVLEPGGAVALAAVLTRRVDVAGRAVVLVLSGGNVDAGILQRALA
jgi:threonine dehydratase